jgi:hypothetical protein
MANEKLESDELIDIAASMSQEALSTEINEFSTDKRTEMETTVLSTEAITKIIGCKSPVPLTPQEMARSLRVAFYPSLSASEKLEKFLATLRAIFIRVGVNVMSYDDALREGNNRHIGKGIVLIAAGDGEPGNLAIDHVASLTENTVVGVYCGKQPGIGESRLQRRVDALVGALVWHMVHGIIYVDDESWTICNMNGAIDTFSLEQLEDRVLYSLIPKLAAPVVPPQKGDFTTQKDAFEPRVPKYQLSVHDMLAGSALWGESGLLATQTRLDELTYRNHKYKRIAAAYLSCRTGMSYGFLCRQLPLAVPPAMELDDAHKMLRRIDWERKDFIEIDGHMLIAAKLRDKRFVLRIPEVTVLCTRSGCDKARPDPSKDLVTLTLSKGRVLLGLARGLPEGSDCQPSFDTLIILAHAVGNAILASILAKIKPDSKFTLALKHQGLAIAHWHGFIDSTVLPEGYYLHGDHNPPVSCSTPQAAIYALMGKFAALQKSIAEGNEFLGDAHIEPSHGTNLCGRSIKDLARLVSGPAGISSESKSGSASPALM